MKFTIKMVLPTGFTKIYRNLGAVIMKQVKVIMLILTTLMLAWLLTDYNIFQYTFFSDVFLIGLSICWIKCFDLVIGEEE